MSFYQGQHVTANFPHGAVRAVVLEVDGDELVVQEEGAERAERIPASACEAVR